MSGNSRLEIQCQATPFVIASKTALNMSHYLTRTSCCIITDVVEPSSTKYTHNVNVM